MNGSLSASRQQIRVGAVSYLNTKPLVFRLTEYAPGIAVTLDLPSRLADQLARGELDVALVPSIEFFWNEHYSIISDACIGCRGPVWSVKLLSRVPLDAIRTLALDEGSRTSAALARILLEQQFGIRPRSLPLPIDQCLDQAEGDALLVIGDRAIHPSTEGIVAQWDLGEEWCRWAQLPFVFAMWVARPGFASSELAHALEAARDDGLAHLAEIAQQEASGLGLSSDECLAYLRDNLHFVLGPREREGLDLFWWHAARMELAPRPSHGRKSSV